MQDINLLQNKIKDREAQWQRNNSTANIILFLLLLVIGGVGGLFWYLNSDSVEKLTASRADTVRIQGEIDAQQETLVTATNFQAQLKNLKSVLDGHIEWSNFFDELTKHTLTGSSYLSIQGSLANGVHLEGITPTYESLSKILLGLSTSESFTDVILLSSDGSLEEESGYNYSIDIELDPLIFIPR